MVSALVGRHKTWLFAAQGKQDSAFASIDPSDLRFRYEITSNYALLGRKKEAIEYIEEGTIVEFEALQDFLYSFHFLVSNSCYASLNDEPAFRALLAREKKKYGGL